jgi:hypothetical protein
MSEPKRKPTRRRRPRALKTADGRLVAFSRVSDHGIVKQDVRLCESTHELERRPKHGHD